MIGDEDNKLLWVSIDKQGEHGHGISAQRQAMRATWVRTGGSS